MKRGSRGSAGGERERHEEEGQGEREEWGGRDRERERNPASEQALFSVFYGSATAQYKNYFVHSSTLSSLRGHTVHIQDLTQQIRTAGWGNWETSLSVCCGVDGGRGQRAELPWSFVEQDPMCVWQETVKSTSIIIIKVSLLTRKLKYSS